MKSGFKCPICKDSPCEVVMDATSLSFRKDFDPIVSSQGPSVEQESRLKTGRQVCNIELVYTITSNS